MNFILWALLPTTQEYQLAGLYTNEHNLVQAKIRYTEKFGPQIKFLQEGIIHNEDLLYCGP